MTKLGKRLIKAAEEGLAIARDAIPLEQVIANLPPADRAKVLARSRELIAEENQTLEVATRVMKRRRKALRELAKR